MSPKNEHNYDHLQQNNESAMKHNGDLDSAMVVNRNMVLFLSEEVSSTSCEYSSTLSSPISYTLHNLGCSKLKRCIYNVQPYIILGWILSLSTQTHLNVLQICLLNLSMLGLNH